MMIDGDRLEKALKTRTIATRDGTITKPLTAVAATSSRDSLAMTLYSRLFDWLVGGLDIPLFTHVILDNGLWAGYHFSLTLFWITGYGLDTTFHSRYCCASKHGSRGGAVVYLYS
jgi:hypothetical protein